MKAMHGLLVAVVACVTVLSARAEDIVVSPLIAYEKDAASDDVRKECDWNTVMPRYLAKESEGRVKVAEQGADARSGKTLTLVATNLHTAGGGAWSGPKWLALSGELKDGDKLLGNFEARRQTIRGSMRGCATLNSLSEDIAGDILEWLKTPRLNAKLGDAK